MGHEASAIQHLADRYMMRLAAEEACRSVSGSRIASVGLTPEVVAAFAEHFYLPQHQGKVAFGGLVRKLKKLVDAFKKAPKLWDRFKKAIGVQSLSDLPGAIKNLASGAVKGLRKILHSMFDTWPLKIYTLEKGKLTSFNALLDQMISKSPKLKQVLSSAVSKVGNFGEMIRQKAPRVVGALMVAIYIWVWLNVVEFEWDMKELVDAVTGGLTFPDFLSTLPGSAFGFLLSFFNFGTFTLLPVAVAARILYLLQHRYVEWTGKGFRVNWALVKADFNVDMSTLPLASVG